VEKNALIFGRKKSTLLIMHIGPTSDGPSIQHMAWFFEESCVSHLEAELGDLANGGREGAGAAEVGGPGDRRRGARRQPPLQGRDRQVLGRVSSKMQKKANQSMITTGVNIEGENKSKIVRRLWKKSWHLITMLERPGKQVGPASLPSK